jgi:hypothetical protein
MKDIARHCPRRAAKVMLTKRSLPIRYCRRLHCRREVAEIVGIHVACDIEDVKISEDGVAKDVQAICQKDVAEKHSRSASFPKTHCRKHLLQNASADLVLPKGGVVKEICRRDIPEEIHAELASSESRAR